MGFAEAVRTGIRKAATFSGRASRSEFWLLVLAVWLGAAAIGVVEAIIFGPRTEVIDFTAVHYENGERTVREGQQQVTSYGGGPLSNLWSLVTLLPLLSAAWRRLHDSGRPGWYVLIPTAVLIGIGVTLLGSLGLILSAPPASPEDFFERFAALGAGLFLLLWALGVGSFVLLIVWLCLGSTPGPNRYGLSPHPVPPPLPGGAA